MTILKTAARETSDKPERFALIALVCWDVVYMNIHCVVI